MGSRKFEEFLFSTGLPEYLVQDCPSSVLQANETSEENPAPWDLPGTNLTGDDNYVILDAAGGQGHHVGCILSIDNYDASNQQFSWPGEATTCSSLTESSGRRRCMVPAPRYFNCAWGFPSGEYARPYHGITLGSSVQEHFGLWSMYRFHIEDSVRFNTSLRVSIEHGHANDQGNDYSSVAYWYQIGKHAEHAELPPVEERLPRRWPEHGLWDE